MKYHLLMRVTHWAMAGCILGLICLGWYMEGLKPEQGKYALYDWHKSFGVLIFLFLCVRIVLRYSTKTPPLPVTIKHRDKKLAHLTHGLLYLFMLAVPVSGYVMSVAGGHPVKFFSAAVPALIEKNKAVGALAHELHGLLAYTLLGLIVLHVCGVIKHCCFDQKANNVLKRMI